MKITLSNPVDLFSGSLYLAEPVDRSLFRSDDGLAARRSACKC